MMGNYYGGMSGYFGLGSVFALVTWIALITFLVLGCVYFWQQIGKKKK